MTSLRSRLRRFTQLLVVLPRSLAVERSVAKRDFTGKRFDTYGRRLGRRLLVRGQTAGLSYLINPVSLTRYFEFDFAERWLPAFDFALDVSSPRLFSYYIAEKRPHSVIEMSNPDRSDAAHTAGLAAKLGLNNLRVNARDVAQLAQQPERFDCIWSLSVIEHIAGPYDDSEAMRWLYGALKPSGRLIITVPVDRQAWDEYRPVPYYGTQTVAGKGGYFFQRYYDYESLQRRLVEPTGQAPLCLEWYGEKKRGRFLEYVQRWQRDEFVCTVEDAREWNDHYTSYDSWEAMPGIGVSGLVIEKPTLVTGSGQAVVA